MVSSKKVWDKEVLLHSKLKISQGKTNIYDSELPETGYIYRIKTFDQQTVGTDGQVTNDDLINYFLKAGFQTTFLLTLDDLGEIKYKLQSQTKTQNEAAAGDISIYQKSTHLSILTKWAYPDNKWIYLFSKQKLNVDSASGLIENQELFLLMYGNAINNDGEADAVAWTLELESFVQFQVQSDDGSYLQFALTFQQYSPNDCEIIEDTFEISPGLSAGGAYIIVDGNDQSTEIYDYSLSNGLELHFYKCRFQLAGSDDYEIENDYMSVYRYHLALYEKLASQEKFKITYAYFQGPAIYLDHLDNESGIATVKSDSLGKIKYKNIDGENFIIATNSGLYPFLPENGYIPDREYVLTGYNAYSTGRLFTEEYKQSFTKWFAGLDGLSILEPYLFIRGVGDTDGDPSGTFERKRTLFSNDTQLIWEQLAQPWEWMILLAKPELNDFYDTLKLHEINKSLLQGPTSFNNMTIDKVFDDEAEQNSSDQDLTSWSSNNDEDRKHFILFPISPEKMLSIIEVQQINYVKIAMVNVGGDDPENVLVPDVNSFKNSNKFKPSWARNKQAAIDKGIPVDVTITLKIPSSTVKQINTRYALGGLYRTFVFKKGNGELCTGTDETGEVVDIPKLTIKTPSNAQFGKKKVLTQQIILGV